MRPALGLAEVCPFQRGAYLARAGDRCSASPSPLGTSQSNASLGYTRRASGRAPGVSLQRVWRLCGPAIENQFRDALQSHFKRASSTCAAIGFAAPVSPRASASMASFVLLCFLAGLGPTFLGARPRKTSCFINRGQFYSFKRSPGGFVAALAICLCALLPFARELASLAIMSAETGALEGELALEASRSRASSSAQHASLFCGRCEWGPSPSGFARSTPGSKRSPKKPCKVY